MIGEEPTNSEKVQQLRNALRTKAKREPKFRFYSLYDKLYRLDVLQEARGRVQRTTRSKDTGRGTPQGSPISSLHANLYMRRFVLGWKQGGHADAFRARIVNYADDLVILCKRRGAQALEAMRDIMGRLKLTVNEAKTRVARVPAETFNFLGYTFGQMHSVRLQKPYTGLRPRQKAIAKVQRAITVLTGWKTYSQSAKPVVERLNQTLRGWQNYFSVGTCRAAHWAIDSHVRHRLYRWHRRKHTGSKSAQRTFQQTLSTLGLLRLSACASAPRGRSG